MYDEIFEKLAKSDFRSKFKLKEKDFEYINAKGIDTIRQHAHDFIKKRIAPSFIPNDERQTPMKGHPVFIAQHGTGTCCRKCISKWHNISKGVELTTSQQNYIVDIIMEWIRRQMEK